MIRTSGWGQCGAAATSLDRSTKILTLADGKKIPYARLLIATGSGPRVLSQVGSERALTLRDFTDSLRIRDEFSCCGARTASLAKSLIPLRCGARASDVSGYEVPGGHYLAEECPELVAKAFSDFFTSKEGCR